MSKRKTHYEKFIERVGRFRPQAKRCAQILEACTETLDADQKNARGEESALKGFTIADNAGIWLKIITEQQGWVSSKKQKAWLFQGVKTQKEANYAMDAFIWEVYERIFAQSANPDGTWSLARTVYSNPNFYMAQNVIADMMPGDENSCVAGAQTMSEVSMQCLSHERSGRRVYEVSPGLADKLKYTELRGLVAEDVRVPYNNIYIDVPPETGFAIYNDWDNQWHELEGAYIMEDKQSVMEVLPPDTVNMTKGLKIVASDGIAMEDREVVRSLSIMFVGGPGKDPAGKPIKGDDALFFFRLYLYENKSVDFCIEDCDMRNKRYRNQMVTDKMGTMWADIFRWCLNVLMYATMGNPDEELLDKESQKLWDRIQAAPEGSKIRKNLQKKFNGRKDDKRIVLGGNITVDRTRPEYEGGTGPGGRKVQVRTRVCGHWRKVRYGKNWASRRMTFVEPFWRGPELGEEVARRHVLK